MIGRRMRAVLATSAAFSFLVPAFASVVHVAPQPLRSAPSLDDEEKAALVDLDSAAMNAKVFAAMAMPYKYGVSQLPCKAKELQPERGWKPVREPAGKVQWVIGPMSKAFWQGIYGVCLIQAPKAKELLDAAERTSLECECNGWLPTN